MRPTPPAEALWPQVRAALATLRQALAPAGFDPRHDAVQMRLTMADATAALLGPGARRANRTRAGFDEPVPVAADHA